MLRAPLVVEGRLVWRAACSQGYMQTSGQRYATYQSRPSEERWGQRDGGSRPPPLFTSSSQSSPRGAQQAGRGGNAVAKKIPQARDWNRSSKGSKNSSNTSSNSNSNFTPRESRKAKEPPKAQQAKLPVRKPVKVKEIRKEEVSIPLPPFISVSDLARVLDVKLRTLQAAMAKAGHTDTRANLLLPYSDAEILLLDFNTTATPLSTSSDSFDIYPRPPAPDSNQHLRPPSVAIMGHVDHGKTTLLDRLRSASVAAGEAGGITQHVGAFSVQVKGGEANESKKITFLDTPGHAAFTKMRGRGAKVTDIVVLVVASDDGVMPQTKEVIQMVKELQEEESAGPTGGLQLIVALSKIDRVEADVEKVKSQLFSEGVQVEEFGGDVPCVEISSKTGEGLDKLQETLLAISEVNELKAERDGPSEGYIIESRVDRGLGNTATVLVKRGCLRTGDYIVAGNGWCKARRLMDSSGKVAVKTALPGDAVLVTGWRDLPSAGDLLLGVEDSQTGEKAEELVKKCMESRKRVEERRRLGQDVTMINENRRADAEEKDRLARAEAEERRRNRLLRMERSESGLSEEELAIIMEGEEKTKSAQADTSSTEPAIRELRLVVKADVSGTVEAVVGAISGIGNSEVRVKVVSAGIGEPSEGDVAMAQAVGGQIIGFNVKASRSLQNSAQKTTPSVKIHCDDVIYRIMSYVSDQCASILPPLVQPRVLGDATIQEVFKINVKGRIFHNVAGCRVTNGTISKNSLVRIMRVEAGASQNDEDTRRVIYEGKLDSLKQVKKEVEEMKRGTECGMAFANFQDFQKGDFVQSYYNEEIPRTL